MHAFADDCRDNRLFRHSGGGYSTQSSRLPVLAGWGQRRRAFRSYTKGKIFPTRIWHDRGVFRRAAGYLCRQQTRKNWTFTAHCAEIRHPRVYGYDSRGRAMRIRQRFALSCGINLLAGES
jgi:hypothetical protein